MKAVPHETDLILFDGFCNFCSRSVRFIIRRDPSGKFRFAASQSAKGEVLSHAYGLGKLPEHSIVLISEGKVYHRSSAALRIVRQLRACWPMMYAFIILPVPLRDAMYNLLSRNRYRLFGRREQCFVPDEKIRDRFL
jgi:predicted DCC family thiol-disulfide oxidoreductase YuxK